MISFTTLIGELAGRRVIDSDRVSQIYTPVLAAIDEINKKLNDLGK